MDGLRQLGFLAAVRARGSPSCTRTVRPVDPVGLDAPCLELRVARVAIEDTHSSSLMTVLRNTSGRSGVGAGDPRAQSPKFHRVDALPDIAFIGLEIGDGAHAEREPS